MFSVHILRCRDGSYYTGHTDNLEKRLHQHHESYFPDCHTATRQPLALLWQQDFPSHQEALAAEQQIKGWCRKKKEAMMAGDWERLKTLATATLQTEDTPHE